MKQAKKLNCPNCGAECADIAEICVSCGVKLPKKKKKKGWLIALAVVVGIVIIGSVGGSDDSDTTTDTTDTTTNTEITETETQTEEIVPEDDGVYEIGEVADYEGFKTTLVSVYEVSGDSYNKPESGNVFVACDFEFDNQSEEDYSVSSVLNFEAYFDDYAYTDSISAEVAAEKASPNGDVAAGKKMVGTLAYEVPADWEELEIRFIPDLWDDEPIIFVATK